MIYESIITTSSTLRFTGISHRLVAILTLVFTNSANAVFSGKWCWDKNSDVNVFSIVINKTAITYVGGYSLVTQSGNRIDDNDTAFHFTVPKKNSIKTKVKSGITGNRGLIQLELIDDKKIYWSVLQFPKGEFDAPIKATLQRCE